MARRTTKVILNEDISRLGEEGDIRAVASGYARNYLLPKGLASLCTRAALASLAEKRHHLERQREEKRQGALSIKEKLSGIKMELPMQTGSSGHLFGAVNSAIIAEKLDELGIHLDRRQIEIPGRTLKETGSYSVVIKLYSNERASLALDVIGVDSHGNKIGLNAAEPGPETAPEVAPPGDDSADDAPVDDGAVEP